jgi:hypothetical protein
MPRGDTSKYTDKQERKTDPVAQSYEERGVRLDPDARLWLRGPARRGVMVCAGK